MISVFKGIGRNKGTIELRNNEKEVALCFTSLVIYDFLQADFSRHACKEAVPLSQQAEVLFTVMLQISSHQEVDMFLLWIVCSNL